MTFDPVRAGARPAPDAPVPLEIHVAGRSRTLRPGESLVIGRDEASDLQVLGPRVSREHLLVRSTPEGWQLVDRSRNGSFAGGRPFREIAVTGPLTVRLGDARAGPEVRIATVGPPPARPTPPPGGRPAAPPRHPEGTVTVPAAERSSAQGRLSAVHQLSSTADLPRAGAAAGPRVRIGRAEDNDVVVADLLVSRHHAELVRRPDHGWDIVDLGSPNGTFVDGARVRRAPVTPTSVVGIGHALFHLEGDRLVEHVDTGDIGFRADGLAVRVGDKTLLSGVGFSLGQRSLLAVVGPSGAGKSTLLRALTGFRPADEGVVEYAGRDLYAEYDELRQRIGLVPQDDILHPQLTVRRALGYAARLRFPTDVSAVDRDRRIDEVITELGLTGQADQRIESLSGGQRKRTSVALELLTRPSLLFLDEPTSGLDPGLDKSVMHTLRGLADDGRTVVVVTHNVAHLDVCDRLLLLAPGGTVAYFGPPREALQYFGVTDFADLFLLLDRQKGVDWADRFRRSPQWARYVGADARRGPGRGVTVPAEAPRQQPVLTQFAVLCRRYLAVVLADRQYTIFMAALPLLLAVLTHALPGDTGLSQAAQTRGTPGSPNSLLLVFVVGAALMGSAAAIREVVKEREIYRRERAIGLSRGAYLASKLMVLVVITGVQSVLLGVLGMLGRPAPDEPVLLGSGTVEIVVALAGVAVASMALGLAVSAAITNADRGMPLLVLLAMLQFILSSALLQIGGSPVLAQLSWLVPARWGFALGASTIAIPAGPGLPTPYREADPLWDHDALTWVLDLGALVGLTVLFAVLTSFLLRRVEPIRGTRRR